MTARVRLETRRLLARRPAAAALTLIVALCTGCYYAPRSFSRLSAESRPGSPMAILPVSPSDIRVTVEALDPANPYKVSASGVCFATLDDIAETTDAVLDTLAGGRNSTLKGPAKLQKSLGTPNALERFRVSLRDPGPADEPWKREAAAGLARATGYDRVLRVKPSVDLRPDRTYTEGRNAGMNPSWKGTITVTIEELDLVSVSPVTSGSGQAKFSGCAGVIGIGGGPAPAAIVIPYGWGDTLSHSVDHAVRDAFKSLYGLRPEAGKSK